MSPLLADFVVKIIGSLGEGCGWAFRRAVDADQS
jgi:hypothetical protein